MTNLLKQSFIALAAVTFGTAVLAAPILSAGTQSTPVPTDVPTVPSTGSAVTARSDFIESLATGYKTEEFESFIASATAPGTLPGLFGASGALTSGGSGIIRNDVFAGGSFSGRWNTTAPCADGKCNWWETSVGFTIDFGTSGEDGFSAFGFYGTDFGDFDGTVQVQLMQRTNGVLSDIGGDDYLKALTPGSVSVTNGDLSFFGITDTARKYDGLRFIVTQRQCPPTTTCSTDYLGFDSLVLGNVETDTGGTPIPEPSSLALAGLALLGLAVSGRRNMP